MTMKNRILDLLSSWAGLHLMEYAAASLPVRFLSDGRGMRQ
jgi:hypothetical protein